MKIKRIIFIRKTESYTIIGVTFTTNGLFIESNDKYKEVIVPTKSGYSRFADDGEFVSSGMDATIEAFIESGELVWDIK